MSIDLKRYIEAQKKHYNIVYNDLFVGHYDSGWIEFIFPRRKEEKGSDRSRYYALADEKEEKAFWNTKSLRENYIAIAKLLVKKAGNGETDLLSPRGKEKVLLSLDVFLERGSGKDAEVLRELKNILKE